jgi:flagellar biosynthesis protein FlhF
LRSYGRILGIPMHIAQDGATLRELLASLQGKRLVLIDTCGLSQRDERMEEMLGTLSTGRFNMQPIRRVLLLNAASHAETLDEVARAWHAPDAAGAILTKLDEAARIGGAVDCLLRYRLSLFGLTNGQRVPEDWHPAGARLIAHVALKPSSSPYTLEDDEALAWSEQPQGKEHA